MERKTRIQKRMPSEKILVEILTEQLQELYLKVMDAGDRVAEAADILQNTDHPTKEQWRNVREADCEVTILWEQFWLAVRNQYNLWETEIGIRDGFQVVQLRRPNLPGLLGMIIGKDGPTA